MASQAPWLAQCGRLRRGCKGRFGPPLRLAVAEGCLHVRINRIIRDTGSESALQHLSFALRSLIGAGASLLSAE